MYALLNREMLPEKCRNLCNHCACQNYRPRAVSSSTIDAVKHGPNADRPAWDT